jgi:hypothetical protein
MNVLISLFKNQSGVTAIEYSLIAALIAVAAIAAPVSARRSARSPASSSPKFLLRLDAYH